MDLSDSFEVDHPVDAVWAVITDVERIAPCLPGAQLTCSDGDDHEGVVKVKVGPVTSQYKGKASFTERDDDAHRLLISASGRDTRGAGNASAKITVSLESLTDTSTRVGVHTDLTITGKVAQFGRGVLADVSKKLMGQFADNLAELVAADVASEESAATAGSEAAADGSDEGPATDELVEQAATAADDASGVPAGFEAADGAVGASASAGAGLDSPASEASEASQEVEAVDLLAVAGGSVMKRLVPVLLAVILIAVVVIIALAA